MAAQCREKKEGYCNEIINDHFYSIRPLVMDQDPTALIMVERQNKDSSLTQEVLVWSPSSLTLFSSLKPSDSWQLLLEENTPTPLQM